MKNIIIGILAGLVVGIVTILLTSFYLFKKFEWASLDFRFIFGEKAKKEAFDDVVIVDIDNETLRQLGRWQNWRRSYYAGVIDYIRDGGAKAIGSDIFFADYSNPKDDEAIIEGAKRTKNLVNSFFFPFTPEMEKTVPIEKLRRFTLSVPEKREFIVCNYITPPIKEIQEVSGGIGHNNRYPDDDGNTRSIPLVVKYQDRLYPSLSLAVVCKALNIDIDQIRFGKNCLFLSNKKIPVEDRGRMWIRYIGPSGSFQYLSFANVLKKKIPKEYFKDRIVLIGGSADGLFDLTSNPFSSVYPGVEINATIIHNILTDNFMTKTSAIINWTIIILLGILIGISSSSLSLKKGIFVMLGILFGYIALCIILFKTKGLWLEMVAPILSLEITFIVVWLWRYSTDVKK